jgi:hypothetical protein
MASEADFVIALQEERDRLQEYLRADEELLRAVQEHLRPNQERLTLVLDLLRRYQASDATDPLTARPTTLTAADNNQRRRFARTETGMFRILDAAAEYLRAKNSRAASPEILRELIRQGLMREDQAAVLSSYLSRAKDIFDNKRGAGYGLREWSLLDGESRP